MLPNNLCKHPLRLCRGLAALYPLKSLRSLSLWGVQSSSELQEAENPTKYAAHPFMRLLVSQHYGAATIVWDTQAARQRQWACDDWQI